MIDMSKVNDILRLRREGGTISGIAKKAGVSEPTVRKYLAKTDFSPKMPVSRERQSKLDPYKGVIDGWLEEDRLAWRKQRHTAKRIYDRLAEEHGADVSYGTVRRYVRRRREEMRSEHEGPDGGFLDLAWPPGEMQADFGQADCYELGVKVRMHHLTVVFPHSNVGFAQLFYGENGECVCEGLRTIFEFVGGVPRRIVFDNATGAGRRVGEAVRLSDTFARFTAHYGFDYSFTNPKAGHEKGAVENKVGAIRRSLLVPVPHFENVAAYNTRLLGRCMAMSEKEHYAKGAREADLFKEDCAAMLPLPEAGFSAISYERRKTDKKGRVCLDGKHWYSTDPSYGGCEVIMGLAAFTVTFFDAVSGLAISEHRRSYGDHPTDSSDPGSQLALLAQRPGGWRSSKARQSMPEGLRGHMDGLDEAGGKADLKSCLRILRDQSGLWGWEAAVAAMGADVAANGKATEANVGVLATRIAGGEAIEYDQPTGLSDYDGAFRGGTDDE